MAKILIVDDALFMRKLLIDILTKEGHEIVGQADNAKDAIKSYQELKPDIMTLDIVMPVIDEMTSLKALPVILDIDKNAKIIMVSAMGQQDIITEYIQAGAKAFIVKPFQAEQVSDTVKKLMGNESK